MMQEHIAKVCPKTPLLFAGHSQRLLSDQPGECVQGVRPAPPNPGGKPYLTLPVSRG